MKIFSRESLHSKYLKKHIESFVSTRCLSLFRSPFNSSQKLKVFDTHSRKRTFNGPAQTVHGFDFFRKKKSRNIFYDHSELTRSWKFILGHVTDLN